MIDVYVAALSFEERAVAAYTTWVEDRAGSDLGLLLLDYESSATPGHVAAELRDKRYSEFERIARRSNSRLLRVKCPAYSSRALIRILEQNLREPGVRSFTIDVTCLTRPHLTGCASFLSESSEFDNWSIAYTVPRAYGLIDDRGQSSRVRDVLSLPLDPSVRLRNQGLSLGIVVLGHDVSRVGIALDEIEPSAGLLVVCGSTIRPDYERLSLVRNQLAIDHLLGLRLSGSRSGQLSSMLESNGWKLTRLELDTSAVIYDAALIAGRVWAAAASIDPPAQIALFPFGPKLAGFALAYSLCQFGGDNVVVVIPTYKTHSTDYSEGIARTYMYSREVFGSAFQIALDSSPVQ